jgi:hypothetical protein
MKQFVQWRTRLMAAAMLMLALPAVGVACRFRDGARLDV